MPEELKGQARGEREPEPEPLARTPVAAGEEHAVPGGEVLPDADGVAPTAAAAPAVRHHGAWLVDHPPARPPRPRAPLHLLVVREEGLVEQAEGLEGRGPEPE